MKLTENIPLESSDLVIVGSQAAMGKTRVLMAIAREFADSNKRVAVITDDSIKIWKDLWDALDLDFGYLKLFSYDQTKSFGEILGDKRYDVLIVDVSYGQRDIFKELKSFSVLNNCLTFTSVQMNQSANSFVGPALSPLMKYPDCILKITKATEFKWYMNILYTLLPFWFKRPNRTINVVKNRRGNPTSFDVNINFKKAKIS